MRHDVKVALAAVTGTPGGPRICTITTLRPLVGLAAGGERPLVLAERDDAQRAARCETLESCR